MSAARFGTDLAKIRSKVVVDENGCWIWQGYLGAKGYGRYRTLGGRFMIAHRSSWIELKGEPPADKPELDHLCRVRSCVNPEHLEPVTHQENRRRAAAAITACPHGHDYNVANTRVYRGTRFCRECGRQATKAWFLKRRATA